MTSATKQALPRAVQKHLDVLGVSTTQLVRVHAVCRDGRWFWPDRHPMITLELTESYRSWGADRIELIIPGSWLAEFHISEMVWED